jgi:hypothetical protein
MVKYNDSVGAFKQGYSKVSFGPAISVHYNG